MLWLQWDSYVRGTILMYFFCIIVILPKLLFNGMIMNSIMSKMMNNKKKYSKLCTQSPINSNIRRFRTTHLQTQPIHVQAFRTVKLNFDISLFVPYTYMVLFTKWCCRKPRLNRFRIVHNNKRTYWEWVADHRHRVPFNWTTTSQ